LQQVIDATAAAHGTVVFAPHLTVCGVPDLAALDAATAYVEACGLLPLRVAKMAVTGAVITPFRAVFIEVEDAPALHEFRERLRTICGAPGFDPPHISLLYTLDRRSQRPRPDLDASTLPAIARDCAAQTPDREFVFARPVVVAPEGEWTNVQSWRVVRAL
jgi:hypothetical protein